MNFPHIHKPPPPKKDNRRPRVVFQPSVHQGMLAGINQLVDAISPTLGPRPRFVVMDRGLANKPPELFDNGGLIARRIVALPDRDADMGAMLLRNLLWKLHEQQGDGTATAAVLYQAVYRLGVKHLSAGGNAMRLRRYLEAGLQVIVEALAAQVTPQSGQAALTRLAETVCYDQPLAAVLGEIMDAVGEYGQVDLQEARGRELEREYYDGGYWKSSLLLADPAAGPQKVTLRDAALLISDVAADDPQQVAIIIEMARQRGAKALVFVVKSLTDPVRAMLLGANTTLKDFRVTAAETPGGAIDDQIGALEDLSVLRGGRPLLRAAGQTLGSVRAADFGQARTVWVDRMNLGVVGGQGNPRATRQHLATLKTVFAQTKAKESRLLLQQRIGRLSGGAATLWIGAATEAELAARKTSAERTLAALRGALLEGTVPGGGAALVAAAPALQARLKQAADHDEQAAYRILLQAVQAPLRIIVNNAGGDPSRVLAAVREAGAGWAYDARTGQVVAMNAAGIVDVAPVLRAAVQAGIAGAAMALTIDVLVQHRAPVLMVNP